ncbi:MAG: nucleotide exchange factor GrpE [Myxococcota bacterium]
MSPKRKKTEPAEGWESLAQEEPGGSLAPNAELEEALREAAEAVEKRHDAAAQLEPPKDDSPETDPLDETISLDKPLPKLAGDDATPQQELEATQEQLVAAKDRLLRMHADFENFRRRAAKERREAYQYGHENLAKDLLSTVDNLDRAIDHARANGAGDLESFLQGVELVRREFLGVLANHGVVETEAFGKPFDPALHEAMAQAPDSSVAPNTVIEVMQKGYQLANRLLRPARVVVSVAEDDGGGGERKGAKDPD